MIKKFGIVLTLLLLAACAGSREHVPYDVTEYVHGTPKDPSVKIGPPYKVLGENYYPKDDQQYSETGLASWYGPNFHGKSTANGERFNQWALTAAHKTLPMPSIVRVTDLDTNKNVLVRVNDRGPFAKGRIIDLSRAAAEELGILGKGVANVRVDFVKDLTEEYISKNNLKRPNGKEYNVARNVLVPPPSKASNSPIPDFAGDDETTLDVRGVKMEEIGYAEDAFAILNKQAPDTPKTTSYVDEKNYADASLAAPAAIDTPAIQTVSFTPEDKKAPAQPTAIKKNDVVNADAPAATEQPSYFIQVGVFKQQTNAYGLAKKLSDIAAADVEPFTVNSNQLYRVTLGPTMNHETAEELLDRLPGRGVKDAKIIRK